MNFAHSSYSNLGSPIILWNFFAFVRSMRTSLPRAPAQLNSFNRRALITAFPACIVIPGISRASPIECADDATLSLALSEGVPHIRLLPDRIYRARVIVQDRELLLEGGPGTVLEWQTDDHYEAVAEVVGVQGSLRLRGIQLRHRSPSVANNYAVFVHDGASASLVNCSVSSSTGTGVGIEAARVDLRCSR